MQLHSPKSQKIFKYSGIGSDAIGIFPFRILHSKIPFPKISNVVHEHKWISCPQHVLQVLLLSCECRLLTSMSDQIYIVSSPATKYPCRQNRLLLTSRQSERTFEMKETTTHFIRWLCSAYGSRTCPKYSARFSRMFPIISYFHPH